MPRGITPVGPTPVWSKPEAKRALPTSSTPSGPAAIEGPTQEMHALLGQPSSSTKAQAAPACGGLHQLAILTGQVGPDAAKPEPVDFAQYRPGMNNRQLYGAIIRNLEQAFGQQVRHGYSARFNESEPGHISIGEKQLDELIAPLATPAEKEAMATFVLAHEYAHVFLKHPDVEANKRPKGFSLKRYETYRKVFELQADYIAARYVKNRGLPLAPIEAAFNEPGKFEASKHYPSGDLRAATVASAQAPTFRATRDRLGMSAHDSRWLAT